MVNSGWHDCPAWSVEPGRYALQGAEVFRSDTYGEADLARVAGVVRAAAVSNAGIPLRKGHFFLSKEHMKGRT